jgi:oligoribonuclease
MKKLLWLDLEMSGLDVNSCRILEVAAIVTDINFAPLDQYEAIIHQPDTVLEAMDAWCKDTHGKSGLTAAVKTGKKEDLVESEFLALIDKHFAANERPVLCGNSIGQDRKFIDMYWKRVAARLHYRMIDVTSYKEIFRDRFGIEHPKQGKHRAIDDIKESIAELSFYLSHIQVPKA